MKKNKTIITILATVLLFSCANNASAQEIKIGTQTWATANLNVSTFRNGDAIPEAKTVEEWKKVGDEGKPAWCYYKNDPANGKKYGKLYNWYAVNDARGLAPKDWHVPSDAEWTTLTDYLGGEEVAGTKMKDTSGWEYEDKNGNGTNTSGFTGLSGGYLTVSGEFYYIGRDGYWWSSTEYIAPAAWIRMMSYYYVSSVRRYSTGEQSGFSVRCLRD